MDCDRHDDIADALERMDGILRDTLTPAREGRTVAGPDLVQIRPVVEDPWENVATDGETLAVEGDRTVEADRGRLRHVFENLFRNAVQHGSTGDRTAADGNAVSITVGVTEQGLYVADDGPGVPESERRAVSGSGYGTSTDGTWSGLPIVNEVAEAHGWEISVTDSETGGARFETTGMDWKHPSERPQLPIEHDGGCD